MSNVVLSDSEFKDLCGLVFEYTGIKIKDEKKALAFSRFSKRLKLLNLSSFNEYYNYVKNNDSEIESFTNAITTNLTAFFRESHHFEFLSQTVIPRLIANGQKKIRIWSAGCSTGEEPYSIAISLLESMPKIRNLDVKILATDIDTQVLSKAQTGIYHVANFDQLNNLMKPTWYKKINGNDSIEIVPKVKDMISFKRLNLIASQWPMKGPFDVIFCRNVIIYFDKDTQKRLISRFADLQYSSAYLFSGHSESLQTVSDKYKHVGKTTYKLK